MRSGATLFELVVVLALVGALLSWGLPKLAGAGDLIAVLSARESLLTALRSARTWATLQGGATVVLVTDSARVRIEPRGLDPIVLPLGSDHGVDLGTAGGGTVRLRFDRMGLGRFASRSVDLTRGPVSRSITISSYGRARRR